MFHEHDRGMPSQQLSGYGPAATDLSIAESKMMSLSRRVFCVDLVRVFLCSLLASLSACASIEFPPQRYPIAAESDSVSIVALAKDGPFSHFVAPLRVKDATVVGAQFNVHTLQPVVVPAPGGIKATFSFPQLFKETD